MAKNIAVKVVLVGDTGVGKTSLSNMFCKQEFDINQQISMGAAFQNKLVQVNDKQINFSIWDTAGQEQFKAIVSLYYRGSIKNYLILDAQVALIVYDITSYKSYERCKNWIKDLEDKGPKNIIKVLVGNKVDLIEQEEVKYDEVSKYAREIDALLKLTSAKENKGITEMFNQIGEKYFYESESSPKLEIQEDNQKKGLKLKLQKTDTQEEQSQKKKSNCTC